MVYAGLNKFIARLEEKGELVRIKTFVNPSLEITEITDRVTKSGGPALLFENNGTDFPLLINAFGSDLRISLALGRENLEDAGKEIESLFLKITGSTTSFKTKLSGLPSLLRISRFLPSRSRAKGRCQQVIIRDPDLGILPVLKCWPYDGGKFITLPIVHTYHPETGKTNAGMYRMQIIDKNTTAMHWQMHKTGANHFEAFRKRGGKMPVSVVLGGDPVYTYAATAPLPENIDEYILAGFLRRKGVKMVKCITNDIFVPEDADFVIEGYVDPAEDPVWEGPFGDHTGFYSLADWYPRFHVTCITHSSDAVYPATIVGIPPQEDAFLAKATEKIFLAPIRLTLQAEVEDLHMPEPGVAHNLVVVKITKSYPGQGMKVINSLFGAGQMMFSKYLVVVSGDIDIRNYTSLIDHIFKHTDFGRDLLFCRGPLDVLDHSSDTFAFGGKLGIDATIKTESETNHSLTSGILQNSVETLLSSLVDEGLLSEFNIAVTDQKLPLLIISAERTADDDKVGRIIGRLKEYPAIAGFRLIIIADHTVDIYNPVMVAWQLSGNSDPVRDHYYIFPGTLLIDGTIKLFRREGFPRKWPNVVCSDPETINTVDARWHEFSLGNLIPSPSLIYSRLKRRGRDEITLD